MLSVRLLEGAEKFVRAAVFFSSVTIHPLVTDGRTKGLWCLTCLVNLLHAEKDSDNSCGSRRGSFIWKQRLSLWQNVFTINRVGCFLSPMQATKRKSSLHIGAGRNKDGYFSKLKYETTAEGSTYACWKPWIIQSGDSLHQNDQVCRRIMISGQEQLRSKNYYSVLAWACRWCCKQKSHSHKKEYRTEESPQDQPSKACILHSYGQFNNYEPCSDHSDSPHLRKC